MLARRYDWRRLSDFVSAVFRTFDVPPDEATLVTDVMVQADLRGVDTHGVAYVQRYTDKLRTGATSPAGNVSIVTEMPAVANLDGGNSLGAVAATRAMEICIKKASDAGAAFVAVRNSNHCGMMAYYSMMALPHDMIGLALTNANPAVVPTFGSKKMFGTNPISFAAPAGDEHPFVLDMATSVVAKSKLFVAQRQEKLIPIGWALDSSGNPTSDTESALAGGALLPLGGAPEMSSYKGYGLALMVEILSGVLPGSGYSLMLPAFMAQEPSMIGHFFAAIRVDAFRPVEEFKADMDNLLRLMKDSPRANGYDRVYVAGEIQYEEERVRREQGIPLDPKVARYLQQLGSELGIPWID